MNTPFDELVLGRYFEDMPLGLVQHSAGRTISDADILLFGGLTGDLMQVHTDDEYCREREFGGRIAHGLLGLSMAQGLMLRTNYTQGTGVASLGWDEWRFVAPIRIGDTIRVRWTIRERRESRSRPDMGIVAEFIEVLNQHGAVVQHGIHRTMIRRRPIGTSTPATEGTLG
ncbi:MAG: dehydratase [Hyphomicrobiales bacterium]|nr:MAG: dehydratase [Hyphomicrobiales bacterium]